MSMPSPQLPSSGGPSVLAPALYLHGHDVNPASVLALAATLGAEVLAGPLVVGALVGEGLDRLDGPGRAWFEVGGTAGPTCVFVRASTAVAGRIIIGYSQGAAMAFALACDGSEPPAAVVCVAGFVADDVDPSRFAASRLLVVHSDDDAVVDPFYGGLLARHGAKAGASVARVSYEGGHGWTDAVTTLVQAWLATV